MNESGRLRPWYNATPVIVLLLVFLPIVGLFDMWRGATWRKDIKVVVTVAIPALWLILSALGFIAKP